MSKIVFVFNAIGLILWTLVILFLSDRFHSSSSQVPTPSPTPETTPSVDAVKQKDWFGRQVGQRQRFIAKDALLTHMRFAIVEEIACSTKVRLGGLAGGGYWTCNPWLLPEPCVLFSLGVGGDSTFEADFERITGRKCRIFSFDPESSYAAKFKEIKTAKFLPWKLTNQTNSSGLEFTVWDAKTQLGVNAIDVLKVDIERSEYAVMPRFFLDFAGKLPCQILQEFHCDSSEIWHDFFRLFYDNGYYLFAKEDQPSCKSCVQYGFVHRDCLDTLHLSPEPFHRNFDKI